MSISLSKIEMLILKYSNAAREKQGLRKLLRNNSLRKIAKSHSQQMARIKDIWHGDGVHQAGGTAGENVALMHKGRVKGFKKLIHSEQDIARALVRNWMNSPGHRANILNTEFGSLGVGVARNGSGFYATQLFNDGGIGFDLGIFFNKKTRKIILNSLWWWLTFALGLLAANSAIDLFKFESIIITSLLCGVVIEVSSQIAQCLRFKNEFLVNRNVVLWFIMHSVSVYVIRQFIPLRSIVVFSVVFSIVTTGIWRVRKKKYRSFRDFFIRWFNILVGISGGTAGALFFEIENSLATVLIIGFSIQFSRKIIQFLREKSEFRIDKWFFFWGVVFSILYVTSVEILEVIRTVSIKGISMTRYFQFAHVSGELTLLSLTILLGYYFIRKVNLHKKVMSIF
jgi:hypothetical protein